MKKLILSSIIAVLFLSFGCNNSGKNSNKNQDSTKIEVNQKKNYEEVTIKAKFDAVYTNSSGAIFTFIDENGKRFDFYDFGDKSKGMEFTHGLQPNNHDPKFDNIWFEVTYTTGLKEFYDGGTGKTEEREVIYVKEAKQLGEITSNQGFGANELKKLQFNGVEPNWTLIFKENYAEYTPMGESTQIIYYKKDYGDQSKPKLSAVAKPDGNGVIEFQGSLEGWGASFTIRKENCSDGMSDNTYPYSVDLMFDESETLKGCGRIK